MQAYPGEKQKEREFLRNFVAMVRPEEKPKEPEKWELFLTIPPQFVRMRPPKWAKAPEQIAAFLENAIERQIQGYLFCSGVPRSDEVRVTLTGERVLIESPFYIEPELLAKALLNPEDRQQLDFSAPLFS